MKDSYFLPILMACVILIPSCAQSRHQKERVEQELKQLEAEKEARKERFKTSNGIREGTEISPDEFRKDTWILGPYMLSGKNTSYRLEANFHNDHGHFFQAIIVNRSSPSARYALFYKAYDSNGVKLKVIPIDAEVRSEYNTLIERVAIIVSHDMLEAAYPKGLSLKLFGKYDQLVVTMEPHYISGFLGKVQESGLMKGSTEQPQNNQL